MKTVHLNAAYFPGVELLSGLATAGILLYGGIQAVNGDITIGVLVAFLAALNNFFDPIQQLSQLYTTYQSGMAALDKIFELLDEEPDLVDAPDATDLPRMRGEIVLDDVTFTYGGDANALTDVTLRVPPGPDGRARRHDRRRQVDASPSSSRASTTRRAGRVLVDGHDLRDVTASSLRSQMGIVPQEAFLFSGTIAREHRVRPPGRHRRGGARGGRAPSAPTSSSPGWSRATTRRSGERGVQLSAGQRQLVAFARALVADPRILVLDEATSNVDVHTESKIEAGLRRLLAGRTAIVIAHRLSTIERAGQIVVLEHGRIVEQGTHAELLAARGALLAPARGLARAGDRLATKGRLNGDCPHLGGL